MTNVSQATATIDRNGNLNCAYRFDNRGTTEQFLTTTQTDFLNNLSSFSISMWYQPIDSTRAVGDFESLLVRGDNRRCPNRGGEWSVGLYDCRKAVFGHNNSVWANAISMNGGCQGEVETLTGNWHHVVAVKSNDTYKIYFNQNLDETDTGDANCGSAFIAAADIGDLFVGRMYTGDIDDIMIFNKELSQQEVTELFNLDTCCD